MINDITASMTRVQYSFEPHTTYAAIVGSAAVPSGITNSLVDVVANKSIGQLTSVPGPSGQVKFGGTPVGGLLGWVPMTGAQSLGVCIYSYNGQVSVGIATDAGLVPEPGMLAELIGEQFETFAGWND
ncbi:WS/DGAT domain-containing protein [Dietzia aerolata]|uniref:WS/DGAT domain-containing protein n=1 Tax=Dietzia aerolata TaxID=595984 RepID=UPI00363A7DD0